jgi:NRAMP (natural resistance-associated macrophage protein)-like metal ion transporter
MPQATPHRSHVGRFFANLGPGLITGAADDDPSGISTYSVAGATLGFAPLWTALFSFPLMVAVQLMCARLGMVTGRGLAANIRIHFPRWVMWAACSLLLLANLFNIGADLSGMAETTQMVTGIPPALSSTVYAAVIVVFVVFASYRKVAAIFKWLTLVLFAYILTAFIAHPAWKPILQATFRPSIQWSRDYFMVLTGIMGTTISPYLFFWQSSQEVEEERALGRNTVAKRKGATDEELAKSRIDVATGMLFSNLVMYFIILTTAATLHAHGMKNIESARQAAEALRPLAGPGAYWLFTLGIIGTGMLAIPVLAPLGRFARQPPACRSEVLRRAGCRGAGGPCAGIRRVQSDSNVIPLGGAERHSGSAADCPRTAAYQPGERDGPPAQPARAGLARMGLRNSDDGLRGRRLFRVIRQPFARGWLAS